MIEDKDRLYSPKVIKQLKNLFGFNFSKGLGQNFLIDGNIVRAIVKGAEVSKEDYVLEVGPGFGTLTEELLMHAKKVVAVEIDESLNPVLMQTLKRFGNFVLVNADILKADLDKLVEEQFDNKPFKVVANLPYYITSPIIERFLEADLPIQSLTIMVQKEVGERILAEPGSKTYGSLTVFTNFYSNPSLVTRAPKSVFMPQPKVYSVVIKLDLKDQLPQVNQKIFFNLMRGAFTRRRKNILNSLLTNPVITISRQELKEILDSLSLSANLRAEDLSLEDYVNISQKVENKLLGD